MYNLSGDPQPYSLNGRRGYFPGESQCIGLLCVHPVGLKADILLYAASEKPVLSLRFSPVFHPAHPVGLVMRIQSGCGLGAWDYFSVD